MKNTLVVMKNTITDYVEIVLNLIQETMSKYFYI